MSYIYCIYKHTIFAYNLKAVQVKSHRSFPPCRLFTHERRSLAFVWVFISLARKFSWFTQTHTQADTSSRKGFVLYSCCCSHRSHIHFSLFTYPVAINFHDRPAQPMCNSLDTATVAATWHRVASSLPFALGSYLYFPCIFGSLQANDKFALFFVVWQTALSSPGAVHGLTGVWGWPGGRGICRGRRRIRARFCFHS